MAPRGAWWKPCCSRRPHGRGDCGASRRHSFFQKSLGEFAVQYEVNAYTDDPQAMMPLYSALHSNILDLFNEYGVQIMVPAYEQDPEQPKLVPRGEWFPAPGSSASDGNSGGSSGPIVRT